jgi:hypothetical protein
MPRCKNGTHRNKKTGKCEEKLIIKSRCENGTRRNKKTGKCEENKKPKNIQIKNQKQTDMTEYMIERQEKYERKKPKYIQIKNQKQTDMTEYMIERQEKYERKKPRKTPIQKKQLQSNMTLYTVNK